MLTHSMRLAPFGNVLLAYQKESIKLDFLLYLFVGVNASQDAYASKRGGVLCTYLPYGDDFSSYIWPVKGQRVVVYDTGGMTAPSIKKMCFLLFNNFSPQMVLAKSENFPLEIYLAKDKTNG